VVIDVTIETEVGSFFVLYTLDCSDGWTGARTFIQGCRVMREDAGATSVEELGPPSSSS
jgi:hypothetical protein